MNINEPTQRAALTLPFTKSADPNHARNPAALRIPFLSRMPDSIRNHFIAMCGEYVGTVLFLYFAFSGCQVANTIHSSSGMTPEETGATPQQLQYIALSFGFSLAVNAWVFFRISGGLFNPAVTFGMCLIGALPWLRGTLLFFAQILGGITAAALVSCMFPGPLAVQTSLGGGTTVVRGLFIEMILTAELVFTIFMLAAEKHKATFIAPIGIGLALFIAHLSGLYFTGSSLNPARSFGPAVVNYYFDGYHWIYWVGPFLGASVASGFYKFIKILEYETANPGQDAHEAPIFYHTNAQSILGAKISCETPLGTGTKEAHSTYTNGVGESSMSNDALIHRSYLDERRSSKAKTGSVTADEAPVGTDGGVHTDERATSHPGNGRNISQIV